MNSVLRNLNLGKTFDRNNIIVIPTLNIKHALFKV